ncbi:MAG: hypothetical protein D6705_04070, partial [Deltaproteobacteria bacterium]
MRLAPWLAALALAGAPLDRAHAESSRVDAPAAPALAGDGEDGTGKPAGDAGAAATDPGAVAQGVSTDPPRTFPGGAFGRCAPHSDPCVRPHAGRMVLAAVGLLTAGAGLAGLLLLGERAGARDPAGWMVGAGG